MKGLKEQIERELSYVRAVSDKSIVGSRSMITYFNGWKDCLAIVSGAIKEVFADYEDNDDDTSAQDAKNKSFTKWLGAIEDRLQKLEGNCESCLSEQTQQAEPVTVMRFDGAQAKKNAERIVEAMKEYRDKIVREDPEDDWPYDPGYGYWCCRVCEDEHDNPVEVRISTQTGQLECPKCGRQYAIPNRGT